MTEEQVNIEQEAQPEDIALPRSSMISVRLSKLQSKSDSAESNIEDISTPVSSQVSCTEKAASVHEPEVEQPPGSSESSNILQASSVQEPEIPSPTGSPRSSGSITDFSSHESEEEEASVPSSPRISDAEHAPPSHEPEITSQTKHLSTASSKRASFIHKSEAMSPISSPRISHSKTASLIIEHENPSEPLSPVLPQSSRDSSSDHSEEASPPTSPRTPSSKPVLPSDKIEDISSPTSPRTVGTKSDLISHEIQRVSLLSNSHLSLHDATSSEEESEDDSVEESENHNVEKFEDHQPEELEGQHIEDHETSKVKELDEVKIGHLEEENAEALANKNAKESKKDNTMELGDDNSKEIEDDNLSSSTRSSDSHAASILSEIEIEPTRIPLPTSSMITVRLSELQTTPKPFESTEENVSLPSSRRSSNSGSGSSSNDTHRINSIESVDWEGLEKTEQQEPKDEATDESTALLIARLEKENAALAHDPKSAVGPTTRLRSDTRRPSVQHLKKLVDGPQRQSLRYSMLPAPAMTELEFWAALVQDYAQTAQRLPTLTSNKIRGGVPPPLRGVVWPSIAGAHDAALHAEFQRLSQEDSPYDSLIGKDVSRSFPNVEMFREKDGEGQKMLGRVLKAFSLYDDKIGYCQGLGFVVGPLLMHMGEAEAFCILVRLMEHYDLRSCYLPDLSGLHLRIYQFQALLTQHLPDLAAHFEKLKIEPLYASQWFLSFFAVTCPLPMLLRIYDVILAEGAIETLMRVALSLMQRNKKKLLGFMEFEDVMQFLLSRSLWDTYAQHADELVSDFVALTSLVSREALETLEGNFKNSQHSHLAISLKNAASNLLGRFWAGSHNSIKSGNLVLMIPGSRGLRKSPSGTSLNSTLHSVETSVSDASTLATELSDAASSKAGTVTTVTAESVIAIAPTHADRDLHHQIEDLLTALSKMQHQQVELSRELQQEREERAEDREVGRALLSRFREQTQIIRELAGEESDDPDDDADEIIEKAQSQFAPGDNKRDSIAQSKHQLRDAATDWKKKLDEEAARCRELTKQLDEGKSENAELKENLRDARARFQDSHRDKQRLERTIKDLRSRNSSGPDSPTDVYTPVNEYPDSKSPPLKSGGLRELKLGRPESMRPGSTATLSSFSTATFSKRSSSLNTQAILATEHHEPVNADTLLLELVNAKTAEAVARQELEETKGKLDALRKILGGPTSSPVSRINSSESPTNSYLGTSFGSFAGFGGGGGGSGGAGKTSPAAKETIKAATHTPSASAGGFFSGWVKRG